MENIFTVIVNWNLKDDTIACIKSVIDAGIVPQNIILMDNGSHDGSASAIRQAFDGTVTIIENTENLGFAVANNIGINTALRKSAEWIFILNNDTIISATFFSDMRRAHAELHAYVYAPMIRYFDEPERVWYLGDKCIPGTLFTRGLLKNKPAPNAPLPPISVDFASGCGVLIHRNVFETIGLFNPTFFMYGEDVDLMWRVRQAGFRIIAVPNAVMWHKVSRSAGKDSPATRYWKIRNQIRFYKLHTVRANRALMFMLSSIRTIVIGTRDILSARHALLLPLFHGWVDGWRSSELYSKGYIYGNRSV